MGIESEQLVFDYLSRVGDLAHGTSMTAAERARLVSGLRTEIDRLRAADGGAQSKAAVRKILGRLGTPEDVVASASGGTPWSPAGTSGTSRPTGSSGASGGTGVANAGYGAPGETAQRTSLWKRTPAPRTPPAPQAPAATAARGPSGPHLAGSNESGAQGPESDWWEDEPTPFGSATTRAPGSVDVPGFIGGIELPELLAPPTPSAPPSTPSAGDASQGATGKPVDMTKPGVPVAPAVPAVAGGAGVAEAVAAGAADGAAVRDWRRLLRSGLFRRGGVAGPRAGGIVEWAAAVLLVAGAAVGSLVVLGVGWLAAWWCPRLTRGEAKTAVLGMPGAVVAGTAVWLWGRIDGRWGAPLRDSGEAMQHALAATWPVALRVAAVASALYVAWRARRVRA